MERLIQPTWEHQCSLFMYYFGSFQLPEKVSAIVCFPGEGEKDRIDLAIELFEESVYGTLLLFAGSQDDITEKRKSERIFYQGRANNTPEQAEWVLKVLKDKNKKSFVLTTAFYHLPRAFLTMLRQIYNMKLQNYFAMVPAILPPKNHSFSEERVGAEIERIKIYQEKGDVASFDMFFEYFEQLHLG